MINYNIYYLKYITTYTSLASKVEVLDASPVNSSVATIAAVDDLPPAAKPAEVVPAPPEPNLPADKSAISVQLVPFHFSTTA